MNLTARRAHLVVGPEDDEDEYDLDLGCVDPTNEITGVQARLCNLGYDIERISGVLDEETRAALREFQEEQEGLKPTGEPDEATLQKLDELTAGYSAAAFASLRSHLKASGADSVERIVEIVHDHIPPPIGLTRRYQALQALINCTRRSLLPDPKATEQDRETWQKEARALEAMGIS